MAAWKWVLTIWSWFLTVLHVGSRNRTIVLSMSETPCVSDIEKLRNEMKRVGIHDHDILRQRNRIEWPEWHLNIDENGNPIKIAEKFHPDSKKCHRCSKRLKSSPSMVDKINTIEETFLEFMSTNDEIWNKFRDSLKQACEDDSPKPIIRAYTSTQLLSERLNKHLAANTYHALRRYCTLLNCPILAQTQEYTEAITSILFHPKLKDFLVHERTVYRGAVLKDKKLVANYKKGATIITTTFLSTSTNPQVADAFSADPPENEISIFCQYNISNKHRQTALDVRKISEFGHEEEILILPYVPFTIKSVERTDDGRRMKIWFVECNDECNV